MSKENGVKCGGLLRQARQRHGLDQAQLARRVGTSQSAISRIERDTISPTLNTLNRLLDSLGEGLVVSTTDLNSPPAGGGNQTIAELRAGYSELSAEERLEQAAQLSEIATDLAAGAETR